MHDAARAMVAIEAARFHLDADRGIERAVGVLGDRDGELSDFEQHVADRHRDADVCREPRQLARRVEARAALLDAVKPAERARDGRLSIRAPRILIVADDLDGRERSHHGDGVDTAGAVHLAFASASATASWNASVLSVAPET